MGEILGSFIMPHPPIIVPEVGKGSEAGAAKTIQAINEAAAALAALKPSTVILTSPHGAVFSDFIYIPDAPVLSGTMGQFGAKNVKLEYENNRELAAAIAKSGASRGIPCGALEDSLLRRFKISRELDHGAMVPLYFVNKQYSSFKLVHISMSMLPFEDQYLFGKCIREAVEQSKEQVVFIASGDMSHRLTEEGPYGYNPRGPEFDALLVESFNRYDPLKLLQIDGELCEEAGECGLRSFLMMFGALDGYKVEPTLLSYEGPFGVGYSIASFIPSGQAAAKEDVLKKYFAQNKERMEELRRSEDPYTALARRTLEEYVRTGRIPEIPPNLPEELLEKKAGVFVSIKKGGQLRGCIGTIEPVRKSIAEEILYNAVSSGTQDPRFDAVEEDELEKLVYSVDVLKEPEAIHTREELDVKRYGVIVRSGRRSGLLLPNLEGVDTVEQQLEIALQKAGIGKNEQFRMERFEVIRHK